MQMIDLMKRLAELDAQNSNVVNETSWLNGKQQSDDEPVWKQTSLSMADAVAKFGKENVKIDGKNRLGEPIVAVKAPLVSKEEDAAEGFSTDTTKPTTWHGHKIVANRKTSNGSFLIIQNKNDSKYEIHKHNPDVVGGLEFMSAHGTPDEMQAAFKKLTGVDESQQGVAEGSGPKEKQHDKYVDRSSPESKAKVQAAKDKMDTDKKAEPGKKLADKIAKKDVAESLEECGMMGGMSHPHSPASINMTAATGEELSAMLKDIMTLAGRPMQEPMGGEEPVGGADSVAVVDVEPSSEPTMGDDEPSIMRSMLDKLNPGDDQEEKTDEVYDNSPDEAIAGPEAAVPSGNDLHKEKGQYPAAQRGDNAMAAFENLMAEYKNFIKEN